jgi:hypothetical protein
VVISKEYKNLSDITGVPVPAEAYSLNSLTYRMKKMEIEQKDGIKSWGSLNVKLKHPDHDEKLEKLTGYGYLSKDEKFFRFKLAKHIDGHVYYMAAVGSWNLEIDKIYTLSESPNLIRAHLEFDKVFGDQSADGTFRLTKGKPYPQGVFDFVEEGAFSASGDFEFQEVRK